MKKLLTIVFVLISILSFAQSDKTLITIKDESDWDKVNVVFDQSKTIGLIPVDTITGSSGYGGVLSVKGGKVAIEKIKREAAKNKCSIVLITKGWDYEKEKPISGYGKGVKLTGVIFK